MKQLASVGDTIECEVLHPRPAVLRARLSTPEACAMGNELLMDETGGWRLSDIEVRHYKCRCGHKFKARQRKDDEHIKHCPCCEHTAVQLIKETEEEA